MPVIPSPRKWNNIYGHGCQGCTDYVVRYVQVQVCQDSKTVRLNGLNGGNGNGENGENGENGVD